MKKFLALISVAFAAHLLQAAQFQPAGGGDLDNAANWSSSPGTMAVQKAHTGPLTISTSPASLPVGSTSLSFRSSANVCDFGAGNELALGNVPLFAERGGTLTLKSGKITGPVFVQDFSAGPSDDGILPGTLVLDGSDALVEPTTFAIRCYRTTASAKANRLVVTNGARLSMPGQTFNMFGGWNAGVALFTGTGSSFTAENLVMGARAEDGSSYDGYLDKPGVQRRVEFTQNATGSTTSGVTIGDVSGGNVFKVSDGATFICEKALRFGPAADTLRSARGAPTIR